MFADETRRLLKLVLGSVPDYVPAISLIPHQRQRGKELVAGLEELKLPP
jgi:hypothetical protein